MSDFLTNNDNNNYQNTENNNQQEELDSLENHYDEDYLAASESEQPKRKKKRKRKRKRVPVESEPVIPKRIVDTTPHSFEPFDSIEDDFNDDFNKKQQKRKRTIGIGIVATCVVCYFIYYQASRVTVPSFEDKTIVDVRKWADQNRIKAETTQTYSDDVETDGVITQSIPAKKRIKKGSKIVFTVSEGADPKEKLTLPDFEKMSSAEAEQWIVKNNADNLSIIQEFDDKVEKGKFIKFEFADKKVTKDNYLRKDVAKVYYSKGKEIFEKNISVPDFTKKSKSEVEEWAKKNDVDVEYKEIGSDKIEPGFVESQSIPAKTKIAKKEKMSVTISIGQAVTVPNFSDYTAQEATKVSGELNVLTKESFSDTVPYGKLISQSVEPGTKLATSDERVVSLVYSAGKPYIKSYFGQLEGDIPKIIYNDFNSKGASVTYEVYYMDSECEKGQIVAMNVYNQYIPMKTHLVFGISNGAYAPLPIIYNN